MDNPSHTGTETCKVCRSFAVSVKVKRECVPLWVQFAQIQYNTIYSVKFSNLVQFVVDGVFRASLELPHLAAVFRLILFTEGIQRAELVSRKHYGGTLSGALVCLVVGILHEVGNVHATRKEGGKACFYGCDMLASFRKYVKVSGANAQ